MCPEERKKQRLTRRNRRPHLAHPRTLPCYPGFLDLGSYFRGPRIFSDVHYSRSVQFMPSQCKSHGVSLAAAPDSAGSQRVSCSYSTVRSIREVRINLLDARQVSNPCSSHQTAWHSRVGNAVPSCTPRIPHQSCLGLYFVGSQSPRAPGSQAQAWAPRFSGSQVLRLPGSYSVRTFSRRMSSLKLPSNTTHQFSIRPIQIKLSPEPRLVRVYPYCAHCASADVLHTITAHAPAHTRTHTRTRLQWVVTARCFSTAWLERNIHQNCFSSP